MSTWTEVVIACSCGAHVRVRVALGIHVTRAPAVRDEILARRLHVAACGCGERHHVRARFEYTDLERKQFVLVFTPEELEAWPAREAELHGYMRHAFELGAPMVAEVLRGVRGRVVFSQEELREKLVIEAAGLDDGLVECLKVQAFALDPTLALPRGRLHVDQIVDDRLDCVWFADAADVRPARTLHIPASWLSRAERDRGSLEARFPMLFRHGFVSASRLLLTEPSATT